MGSQFKHPSRSMSEAPTQSLQGMKQSRGNASQGAGWQRGPQTPQSMGQRPAQARRAPGYNSLQGSGQASTARGFGQQPASSVQGLEIQRGNTAHSTGKRREPAASERKAAATRRQGKTQKGRKYRRIHALMSAILCALLLMVCGGYWYMQANAATLFPNNAGGRSPSTLSKNHASDSNARVAIAVPTATPTATTPPWQPYTGPSVPLMSISAQDGLVVVSISKQNLTVYNKGQVVFVSLVTTGMPTAYTPQGTFHIIGKVTDRYFSPAPGSNLHYTPKHINYALQLTASGIFIHDSAWRSVYGPGTNFPHNDPEFGEESGSDGCINTPLNIAYWLYKSIAMGTTVQVVY